MALVDVQQVDRTVVWTLHNPPVNAISFDLLKTLDEEYDRVENNPDVRVVVITGKGGAFAAGADIAGFLKLGGQIEEFMETGVRLYRRLETGPKPVVAAVNGVALGGGSELALAADIRIASSRARFGQPEVNLGIIPGWGGTVRLPRLIGHSRAASLLLTGDSINAEKAYQIGLVDQVVEPSLVLDTALNVADRLASLPPLALQSLKGLLSVSEDDAQARETAAIKKLMATQDAWEGVKAFMAKRRPRFQGK